jgi:hypothetical protein
MGRGSAMHEECVKDLQQLRVKVENRIARYPLFQRPTCRLDRVIATAHGRDKLNMGEAAIRGSFRVMCWRAQRGRLNVYVRGLPPLRGGVPGICGRHRE